ncbi:MAG: hypothetical protein AAGK92_10405 [Pseudomonadota bacterium]
MKVTRNTPDQLIVDHYSIFLAIMMVVFFIVFVGVGVVMVLDGVWWGLLFVAGGVVFGGIMLYHTERVQVILDRSTGLLTIRRRNILRYSEVRHDLDALDRVMIETSTSSEDNSQTYRATLVLSSGMSAGKHPITEVYTSVPGPVQVANEINAWLRQGKMATG